MKPKEMTLYKIRTRLGGIPLLDQNTVPEDATYWITEHGFSHTPQEAKDAYIAEQEQEIAKYQARIDAARNL